MDGQLFSIQIGRIAPLGRLRVPSAFVKRAVDGPVEVGLLGIEGDEQADLSVHGGPEKAVYAYAAAHYLEWVRDCPQHADQLMRWGAFGENLSIGNMVEEDIRVGDVHAIGTAALQVCQPRQPCFKFAEVFGDARLPKAMVRNGRAGWYYRVLDPGRFEAGDAVRLVERPNPDFAFTRLIEIVNRGSASPGEIGQLAEMEGVASRIRAKARAALSAGGPLGTL